MAQKLPLDLLFTIIEAGAPSNPRTILPTSHHTTKTLLAWTQVCRATHTLAGRLLRKHCVYIDSAIKLRSLLKILYRERLGKSGRCQPSHARLGFPSQMFLSPFPSADDYTIPRPLDDPAIATGVRDLLVVVAPTLRRLIVDMPLRTLYPEEDTRNVRRLLRDGFSALVNIEELVSVRDELYLNVEERGRDEAEIWATCWPKLRHLSLYNVDMSPDTCFLEHLASVPVLESVIFPRPDGLAEQWDADPWQMPNSAIDIKRAWLDALCANARGGGPKRRRDLTIMFVNVRELTPVFKMHEESWEEIDPEGRICVKFFEASVRHSAVLQQIRGLQELVRSHALEGTLFDAGLGERVDPPP